MLENARAQRVENPLAHLRKAHLICVVADEAHDHVEREQDHHGGKRAHGAPARRLYQLVDAQLDDPRLRHNSERGKQHGHHTQQSQSFVRKHVAEQPCDHSVVVDGAQLTFVV